MEKAKNSQDTTVEEQGKRLALWDIRSYYKNAIKTIGIRTGK